MNVMDYTVQALMYYTIQALMYLVIGVVIAALAEVSYRLRHRRWDIDLLVTMVVVVLWPALIAAVIWREVKARWRRY